MFVLLYEQPSLGLSSSNFNFSSTHTHYQSSPSNIDPLILSSIDLFALSPTALWTVVPCPLSPICQFVPWTTRHCFSFSYPIASLCCVVLYSFAATRLIDCLIRCLVDLFRETSKLSPSFWPVSILVELKVKSLTHSQNLRALKRRYYSFGGLHQRRDDDTQHGNSFCLNPFFAFLNFLFLCQDSSLFRWCLGTNFAIKKLWSWILNGVDRIETLFNY